jgi:hypothetical protein
METYVRRVFEGEAPCDKCDQADDCKTYEWACRAFTYYVFHGNFKAHTARMPTKELFDRIFQDDDKALKNYLKALKEKQ